MKKHALLRTLALLLILSLSLASIGALAEGQAVPQNQNSANMADFEALYPLMDLVSTAAMYAGDGSEPINLPGEGGTLTVAFTDAFFKAGQLMGASVGVTADMLANTQAQAELLGKIFAAAVPALEPVTVTDGINKYIGFHPVTVNNATANGGIQIMGELYIADKSINAMSDEDFANVQWLDRAIFTFQSDPTALNGFRLTGFSGTEMDMEEALQTYFEEIVVEYVNANLGFTVLYPALFTDEMLVEDADGVSARLPDESASFFAKRVDNVNGASLTDYVGIIANGITGSASSINEELNCGTVSYTTQDGYSVFDVYIVTDKYIYQAELSYLKTKMSEYSMYTSYLENSFVVDEVSVG